MGGSELGLDFSQINIDYGFILLRALTLVVVGYGLARLASLALRRLYRDAVNQHQAMLVQRGVYYLVLGLFVMVALNEVGFNLSVLLGAAGVLTVAIGFASQTSMSNLISGLFLIGEKPFAVGDLIQVGDTLGEVLAIDLLSVKIRMLNNTFVRIPNETIIKSQVSTLTKFPIRRIDVLVNIAYKEDMERIKELLFDVADKNPLCLAEPQPLFIFKGFGESAINIQFSVWVRREEYLSLVNSIQLEIKAAFDAAQVEFPFPHRRLYSSADSPPLPVRMVAATDAELAG